MPIPPLPPQDNTFEFFNNTVNTAKNNLANITNDLVATGGMNSDAALKIAEIQMEMAKAVALAGIAQQLSAIVQQMDHVSTPGSSIRYGLEPLADAIKSLKEDS